MFQYLHFDLTMNNVVIINEHRFRKKT